MKCKNSPVNMTEKEVYFFLGATSYQRDFFTAPAVRQQRDISSSTATDCHNKISSLT